MVHSYGGFHLSEECSDKMAPTELELLAVYYCLSKCHYFTANTRLPIVIYSDCSGLRNFELLDITSMSNKRMINLRDKLQCYNYSISHIAGKRNNIADSLSRTPSWFTKDDSFKSSCSINVEEGTIRFLTTVDSELDTEVVRTVQEIPDLFERDNPGLRAIEEIGKTDRAYSEMLLFKRTGTAHKHIPHTSEASKMGG